jgi:hypothetical protein
MFGDRPKQLPHHFAVVVVPEFTMMPVTSAIEPLRIANRLSEKTLYKWTMHSVDGQPVACAPAHSPRLADSIAGELVGLLQEGRFPIRLPLTPLTSRPALVPLEG